MKEKSNHYIAVTCFILLAFILGLISCKSIVANKFKIGKEFRFTSKKQYLDYIRKRALFPDDIILYPDSASYVPFMMDKLQNDGVIVYVGTYFNDSVIFKKTTLLQDNESCSGRIQSEIKSNISRESFPDSLLMKGKSMSGYRFFYLSNHRLFKPAEKDRLSIYLFFAYGFGNYYDSFYKDIIQLQKEYANRADVYIVCMDAIYNLK